MLTFAYICGLVFVFSLFITSGFGHLLKFSTFRSLLHEHNIIPKAWATGVAIGVTILEIGGGSLALVSLLRNQVVASDLLLFAAYVAIGLVFASYLAILLRRSTGVEATSCGCSPLSSPLTHLSFVPAALMIATSLTGLAATTFGLANDMLVNSNLLPSAALWLPVFWGITLAAIAILLPGAILDPNLEASRWRR